MSIHRDDVDQARVNLLKTIRTAVRLRHSIAADNELNDLLPKAEAKFNAAVLAGRLPDPLDVKKGARAQVRVPIVGLDIESKRKGSDWGQGSFHFRDLICADMRFADESRHRFLPFDFTREQLDRWAEPLRSPNLLLVAHNGRYDLNGVNATLVGYGLAPLVPNVLSDTLRDGPKGDGWIRRDLGSCAMRYGIKDKGSIDQAVWDKAHAGDRSARAAVKKYNQLDVDVVLALQAVMARRGLLGPPRIWRPR